MNVNELSGRIARKIPPNFHLKVSLSIMYYIGAWPPKGKNRSVYMIGTACNFLFILGVFLSSEVADLIVLWGDMKVLNTATLLLLTNFVHAYKFCVIIFRQKRIRALLDAINSETFSRDNIRHERVLSKYAWKGLSHHIIYQSMAAIVLLCWALAPVVDAVKNRARRLPMQGWYPYNETASPAFEITSLHQTTAIIIACVHNIAIDTLFTGLITVACCQLALLKRNISTINDDVSSRNSTAESEARKRSRDSRRFRHEEINDCGSNWAEKRVEEEGKLYERLKQCVEHSKAIFLFTRELEGIFGTAVFFQFFINCLILCLNAFHIAQMKVYVPDVIIGMGLYGVCMAYQIFIYCWHGNELQIHSTDIALAAYSNKWWVRPVRFKRALCIIITRAQRPFILTAGNIMQLSLNTFVGILQMSYSIFTVLQSTTK